jgi:hypothetical protein
VRKEIKIIIVVIAILGIISLSFIQKNIGKQGPITVVTEPDVCSRDCHSFYEEMPIINYEDVFNASESCYYVYYTIGYDLKTDDTLDDLYNLSLNQPECMFYKVEMNELVNQQYISNEDSNEYKSWKSYEDIVITKFPTLIKFENNVITEVKQGEK